MTSTVATLKPGEHIIVMHMSSQRYVYVASVNIYICILIYNTFHSATFYKDPPLITHAVAKELGPQKVNNSNVPAVSPKRSYSC